MTATLWAALLDVCLPAGRGLDLLRDLRLRDARVDAVLVTAASDTAAVQDALIHGAADHLVRPVTPGRFRQTLNRARERAALWGSPDVRQGELHTLLGPASGLDANPLPRVRVVLRVGPPRQALPPRLSAVASAGAVPDPPRLWPLP